MDTRYAIILAAGKGTRMKSKLYKVLHSVSGKPMVEHVINRVSETNPDEIITIIGHGAEKIKEQLGERSQYALQAEQLGTGHAVLQASSFLKGKEGTTLVINGDTPLLTTETLNNLFEYHQRKHASVTILTTKTKDPTGYGRIIRDHFGIVEKIVEQKDTTSEEALIQEINTGTYCFDNKTLFDALNKIGIDNTQGEYYLTDIIEILKYESNTIASYQIKDFDESMGINDRAALAKANELMRQRINKMHMSNGISFVDPSRTYIDSGVVIGSDTVIEAGVQIKGKTVIGQGCVIGAHSRIINSMIEDKVVVEQSVIENSYIKKGADVGPFAHIRPNSEVCEGVHIGNFVEVKNSKIGKNTKVGHLTYIGDATLGEEINVGCGVVFVNYDGKDKHHTVIGDNSFIGSNVNIIAPVKVEQNTSIAAGSTITDDIPEHALAISRVRQVNKEGYAKKLPYLN